VDPRLFSFSSLAFPFSSAPLLVLLLVRLLEDLRAPDSRYFSSYRFDESLETPWAAAATSLEELVVGTRDFESEVEVDTNRVEVADAVRRKNSLEVGALQPYTAGAVTAVAEQEEHSSCATDKGLDWWDKSCRNQDDVGRTLAAGAQEENHGGVDTSLHVRTCCCVGCGWPKIIVT
jgi:hypothetical protein